MYLVNYIERRKKKSFIAQNWYNEGKDYVFKVMVEGNEFFKRIKKENCETITLI